MTKSEIYNAAACEKHIDIVIAELKNTTLNASQSTV